MAPVEITSKRDKFQEVYMEKLRDTMMNGFSLIAKKFDYIIEEMSKLKETLTDQIQKVREELTLTHKTLAAQMTELELKTDLIKKDLEEKIMFLENNNQLMQNELIMVQYKLMDPALRLRGIKENNKENLTKIISEAFAGRTGFQPNQIAAQINKIYRVNSQFAKMKNLPRDVVVYFTNIMIKNEIVQASYKSKFHVYGKEILILKEIPQKMLKDRREYKFLVEELKKRQIFYRWQTPAGLILNFKGKRHCLNTISQAKDFYNKVLGASCDQLSLIKEETNNEGMEQNKSLWVENQRSKDLDSKNGGEEQREEILNIENGAVSLDTQGVSTNTEKTELYIKEEKSQMEEEPRNINNGTGLRWVQRSVVSSGINQPRPPPKKLIDTMKHKGRGRSSVSNKK